MIGASVITGLAYPFSSDIKIVIKNSATNKHEEYNLKNKGFTWQQPVKPLEENDEVRVTASADGWIGTGFENTVY
ncbi:hypothetical protein [Peptoniphilus genitalis]|uniref:hypothetical protein n=1 Tax=Peptoniphilus genitalis TaxID=3036303 RepID=UPI0024AD3324|nr:hypothetical protein [Peptoniphilus sp. Marseille-Q7072]